MSLCHSIWSWLSISLSLPSYIYNLFKLFFRASTTFRSAGALAATATPFFWTAATATPAAASVTGPTVFWSCSVNPVPLDAVGKGAAGKGTLTLWSALLVWFTLRAVVDSDIAPVLDFGFLSAWIPVYNLRKERHERLQANHWLIFIYITITTSKKEKKTYLAAITPIDLAHEKPSHRQFYTQHIHTLWSTSNYNSESESGKKKW